MQLPSSAAFAWASLLLVALLTLVSASDTKPKHGIVAPTALLSHRLCCFAEKESGTRAVPSQSCTHPICMFADFKNVSIVAHYIKERTRDAQFVIISLRNNMFELADRLVGIYKTNNATKSVAINPG